MKTGKGADTANRGRDTFAEMCARLRERAARVLFEKARVASGVAKVAFSGGRNSAYAVKRHAIDTALRVAPLLFRLHSDLECRRMVVSCRNAGALYWRRFDEAS